MLRPDGVYVLNVIDYPPFRFARAELATFQEQFEYVAAIAPQSIFDGDLRRQRGAGRRRRAARRRGAAQQLVTDHGNVVLEGAALDRFVDGAPVITDDYAPIDQWLDQDE